jgi:hypothetical protein
LKIDKFSRRTFVRGVGATVLVVATPELRFQPDAVGMPNPEQVHLRRDFFTQNEVSARNRPWMPAAGNHENEVGNAYSAGGPADPRSDHQRWCAAVHSIKRRSATPRLGQRNRRGELGRLA